MVVCSLVQFAHEQTLIGKDNQWQELTVRQGAQSTVFPRTDDEGGGGWRIRAQSPVSLTTREQNHILPDQATIFLLDHRQGRLCMRQERTKEHFELWQKSDVAYGLVTTACRVLRLNSCS